MILQLLRFAIDAIKPVDAALLGQARPKTAAFRISLCCVSVASRRVHRFLNFRKYSVTDADSCEWAKRLK
jgi:hypothetical protein